MDSLNTLLIYEKYIPVHSEEEQKGLLDSPPTLIQLQDWNNRLSSRNNDVEERFRRSYDKIIKQMEKENNILDGIRSRFFLVLDELKALGIIGGTKGFSERCGIDRCNIVRRKNSEYGNIPTEWLVLMAQHYSVNCEYLLLGKGKMFNRGFDVEKQKKLQIDCKKKNIKL